MRRIGEGEDVEPESYQDIAVTRWLPRRGESARYERALAVLAARFEQRHQDPWLRDVLASKPGDKQTSGLKALSAAVEANQADDSDSAQAQAGEAERLLRAAGNEAGGLRAELEYTYALERALRSECLDKALALERKAAARNYFWILSQTIIEQGNCRGRRGDTGAAQREMARALAEIRQAGYRDLELRAAGILPGVQTTAGNLLVAWSFARAGLATYWRGAYRGIRGHQIYFNLARSAESLGQHESAYVFARAAALAIAETPRIRTEASTRAAVARLAAAAGWPDEARTEFERAASLFNQLQPTKANREYRARAELDRAAVEVAAGSSQAAAQRLQAIRAQADDLGAVLRIRFHQSLGDALWHTGRKQEAASAYQRAIELSEQRLRTLPEPPERAGLMLAAGKAYRGLVELRWDKGDSAEALRVSEWFRAGDTPGPRGEPDLDRRLPLLRNESFLSYIMLPGGGIAAWAFDDRGIEGQRLAVEPAELEMVAARFLRLCADSESNRQLLQRDARQLYQWLVAPLAHRLDPARTLVIEPDGLLGAIPMQALMDENFRYLGDQFAITISSSVADYQRRAAAGVVTAGGQALVVAGPILGKDMIRAFPPLPQTIREGQAVAGRFGRSVLLQREQATIAAVEQHRQLTELFHFAGHGFSNAGNGGLLLAPDVIGAPGAGVLDGTRMARQDWSRCRLALLSACSTGTGETRGPVNPESLVRGLMWAGVARVVATRWNADAATGVQFTDSFYEALLSGDSVAAALRRAARHLRDNQATSHPYYWAGYQSFGTR
jgi:CHAT domain-containing protein